ncbi:hypothetical protein ACFWIN_07930 [Streptomyces sp. NPDC127049]|uniref:hypothetical protein n=1 Tax=Streptomyces sp. NPDC127049 TaxID=3347118 RepID=UPI0036463B24
MAWDEWEQLKAGSAQGGSDRMRLNQAASVDGGGSGTSAGDLRSDKKAWARAGQGVKGLKEGVGQGATALSDGQAGLGDGANVLSAAAQTELYDSWKKYLGDVNGRCEALGGLLEGAGHDLARSDEAVLGDLNRLKARYEDTEAVGGQAKGN